VNGPSIVKQVQKTAQLIDPDWFSIRQVGYKIQAWVVGAAVGNQHLDALHVPLLYGTGEYKVPHEALYVVQLPKWTAMLDCVGQAVGMACMAGAFFRGGARESVLMVQEDLPSAVKPWCSAQETFITSSAAHKTSNTSDLLEEILGVVIMTVHKTVVFAPNFAWNKDAECPSIYHLANLAGCVPPKMSEYPCVVLLEVGLTNMSGGPHHWKQPDSSFLIPNDPHASVQAPGKASFQRLQQQHWPSRSGWSPSQG
jgi:hypothetical protein